MEEFLETQGPNRKAPAKPKRRWFVRLLLVGLLGAGGWYGKQHGPELYDQYVNKIEASEPAEATAPLAFPNVTTTASPIRTAEFVLAGLSGTPGTTYRVTTDFETDVSQVDITREDAPALQILTYGNDAMIRRADGDQWYLLDRGQFPLDGRLQRSDWVRRIDELIPNDVRARAAIDQSTESTIAGVPTRRLLLTVDPALLGTGSADLAAAPTAAPADPVLTPDEQLDVNPATGAVADPAPGSTPVARSIQFEVWIDGEGLVRQVKGAPQLGAETITILSTSAEPWIPDYPAPEEIAPLTASALVDLGL